MNSDITYYDLHNAGSEDGAPKKKNGPVECAVEGCIKKSRGSSGLCRSHGGGEKCVVEGCTGFARLDGRCCQHGGAQMCSVEGCSRVSCLELCLWLYLCVRNKCAA